MKKIANEAEKSIRAKGFEERRRPVQTQNTAEVLADAAYNAARAAGVTALIVFTTSGSSAQRIARFRPPVASTRLRRMPRWRAGFRSRTEWCRSWRRLSGPTDEMLLQMDHVLLGRGFLRPEDLVVFVAGQPVGRPGTMNLMKVHRLGESAT